MRTLVAASHNKRGAVFTRRSRAGFTVFDLLLFLMVIVALLIAILIPSLARARRQARATLCQSRIGQACRAMLMYAEDYQGTPPFIGRGWEDCDDVARLAKEVWPKGSGNTLGDWARGETWLMPKMPDYWLKPQADWPKHATIRGGTLFPYTRFENLYRCPEFERLARGTRSQNVFNYTRSVLGRKWFHKGDSEAKPGSRWVTSAASDNWCGQAGPIMKTSQIHAPSQLQMLLDEQWDRHCAASAEGFQKAGGGILAGKIKEQWLAADPIFGPWGNEIGRYHGSKVPSRAVPAVAQDQVPAVRRGGVAFYDGHTQLEADPLPGRTVKLSRPDAVKALTDWLCKHLAAQRGLTPDQIKFDWDSFWK